MVYTEDIKIPDVSKVPRTIVSFEWKVPGIFELLQQTNLRVQSPGFFFLGSTWSLHMYPDVQDEPDWIGLYLTKYGIIDDRHIEYSFGIKDEEGIVFVSMSKDHHFRSGCDSLGRWKFVEKTSLLRQDIAPEGTVTFFCTLHSKTDKSKELSSKKNCKGAEKVIQDMKGLLLSGNESDLTLKVQNREFTAHSAILAARSTVFASMMTHNIKERRSRVIEIQDSDPDVFQQFLSYIYSGEIQHSSMDTVYALCTIADKYDVGGLRTSCIQFMMDNLTFETFCDVLNLSMRHDDSELLEKTTEYFAKNMKEILGTARWLSFVKENPVKAIELHAKAADHFVSY